MTYLAPMFKKGDPKITKAWTFYDWANSVYSLVIATAIFPLFFESVTKQKNEAGEVITDSVQFWGMDVVNTELYSYVIAASLAGIILVLPIVSGIADYSGKKKFFLKFFCYLGAAATASLFFFSKEHLEWSMLSVFFASFGFWGSIAIYNSYLPEIAEDKDHDFLSAKGYSRGYVGSVILLLIILSAFIFSGQEAYLHYSFILVAVWWAGFAQYTFKYLPEIPGKKDSNSSEKRSVLTEGFKEIAAITKKAFKFTKLKRYLIAFFVFSMAVQTIMLMAQFFGIKEINKLDEFGNIMLDSAGMPMKGLETAQLIIAILAVQIIAIPGAYFFSWMSKKFGNKQTLQMALFVWILICVLAYSVVDMPIEFYITAGCIGFVMGGTQSLARSTYSKYIPDGHDTTSYFSLYDVAEKIGIVIGMMTYGYIEGVTGSMRTSILSLIVFFALGIILLYFVPKDKTNVAEA